MAGPVEVTVLRAPGAPISLTALSPVQQGDAVSGLTLAVAGVGPAGVSDLPGGSLPSGVDATDAWVGAIGSDTGWYVLLSQDCDVVRDPDDEPTVLIAPLMRVDLTRWNDLRRSRCSSRWYAYPGSKFTDLPADQGVAVDLAWTTSIVKGALLSPSVAAVRPFTGPEQRAFGEWLSLRTGRAAFPDDVVTNVLDPCCEVRRRLYSAFDRAGAPASAKIEARLVAAVDQWFAHHDGRLVHVLGAVTGPRLQAAGLTDTAGARLEDDIEQGTLRLQAAVVKAMNKTNPDSGYSVAVQCVDLARVPASQLLQFFLLVR